MSNNRREFIKNTVKASAGIYATNLGFSAKSYRNIIGANDRVRLGVVGPVQAIASSQLFAAL
jgi:hypothetical protein